MATLREYNSKVGTIWFVDFRYQSKRYRISTKTGDRKLAELFLKDIEVKIAKNRFNFQDLTDVSLREFFETYLTFSEATKAENSFLLDRHSQNVFKTFSGDLRLSEVTRKLVEDLKLSRLSQVKPASVNLELRHLKSMFQTAVEWGKIKTNPFKGVKQVKIKDNGFAKYLTKDEIEIFLGSIPDGPFKDLIVFYLNTGCRRGEALSLGWDDIDLDRKIITITEAKGDKSRIIPINSTLYETLRKMEKNGRPFKFTKWFVTHKFKDYLKIAKINNDLTVHSLRHTFASHLVMSGENLYTVAKLLGHSSVSVTQIYAHLAPDHLRNAVEKLGRVMGRT